MESMAGDLMLALGDLLRSWATSALSFWKTVPCKEDTCPEGILSCEKPSRGEDENSHSVRCLPRPGVDGPGLGLMVRRCVTAERGVGSGALAVVLLTGQAWGSGRGLRRGKKVRAKATWARKRRRGDLLLILLFVGRHVCTSCHVLDGALTTGTGRGKPKTAGPLGPCRARSTRAQIRAAGIL